MLRRLRHRRSMWAAVAAGFVAFPALLGGVAAAPADHDQLLPPLELNPMEELPPDPAAVAAEQALARAGIIADLAPERYRTLVVETADRHQLDPRLVAAVVTVETNWDAEAVGGHAERGLMQILPSTGAYLAGLAGLNDYNLSDPATSLDLGSLYLAKLLRQYGTVEKALAAYNGGPRAVEHWASNGYVSRVLKLYHRTRSGAIRAADVAA